MAKKTKKNKNISYIFHYNGTYSFGRYLYYKIKNPTELHDETLVKVIDKETEFDRSVQGGTIVLSTDVNSSKRYDSLLIHFIEEKWLTLKQEIEQKRKNNLRIFFAKKPNNKLAGWTVGRFLSVRYTAKNGSIYNRNSLCVTVVGIDTNMLIQLAEDICRELDQELVMVKDYTTKDIYFIHA